MSRAKYNGGGEDDNDLILTILSDGGARIDIDSKFSYHTLIYSFLFMKSDEKL